MSATTKFIIFGVIALVALVVGVTTLTSGDFIAYIVGEAACGALADINRGAGNMANRMERGEERAISNMEQAYFRN
ncbi:9908_t:CDS:2 [Acaulospora colombiana]|uniref:9908_t:CDS:1 n=1 Tax=Acaulospora colombiana TaxID=27376 RepID=A0ACA9KA22_9GLOM|nr:9908_t:CDS:2 [Acaulospora colombiana]